MHIEYPNKLDKETSKQKLDNMFDSLLDRKVITGFDIKDFNKSWTNDEMQFSFYLKMGPLDRRVKGIIKVYEDKLISDFELPDTVKNFVSENKIEKTIKQYFEQYLQWGYNAG